MISTNKATKTAGVLFLTAMVSSLVGDGMIESAKHQSILLAGAILEAINAVSVLGIGILLFPVLKKVWKSAAFAYLGFRSVEALVCLSAAILPQLGLINAANLRSFHTGTLIPLFFCGGALIFYTVLFKYRLLPHFISIWGWIGVLLIIYLNVYQPQGEETMLFALPIILNEIFMGIWLIMKGFNLKIKIIKP
ncbi:DUF4386 domain-containing protein [Maribellus sediminis]|uniref:DUF4386 domain-containing protein n=1 Tax=Maribellus sediminis TaxID=2696285 RepID=UPI00142F811A|nr:DUF4386 domain-containing protein [Maribellus sediminis]